MAQRDEEECPVSGHLHYFDHGTGLHLTGPVTDITASATTGPVTFSGTACEGTCTFTVTVGRVPTSLDQCVTFHQAFDCIQLQKCYSRAAYVGQADDVSAIEPEVI